MARRMRHDRGVTKTPTDDPAVVGTTLAQRVAEASSSLTASERQAADVLLADLQRVAFGTVAELARTAGVGAATILRLAGKLGFDGFSALQVDVQAQLSRDLARPSFRVRSMALDDSVTDLAEREIANIARTMEYLDTAALQTISANLADTDRRVIILSGEASAGVAREFMNNLYSLRDEVWLLDGNDVVIGKNLARLRDTDIFVVFSVRPYDRWVVRAAAQARQVGCQILLITDSAVSPVSGSADDVMIVATESKGAFESNVGTLALCNLIATTVALRARGTASERLGQAEGAWRDLDSFIE